MKKINVILASVLILLASSVNASKASISGNPVIIELIDFSATNSGEGVIIEWATIIENNNDYFSIENSTDGVNWFKITDISGAGTSFHVNKYSYTHNNPVNGVSYYRLKQTTKSGESTYQGIIAVNYSNNNVADTKFIADKENNELYIKMTNVPNPAVNIFVYDANNNRVMEHTLNNNNLSEITTSISFKELSNGIYHVELSSGNYLVKTKFTRE